MSETDPVQFPAISDRVMLVGRAVRTWTGELVDLGGRNTLLYYRDLKQGTLDIGPGSTANDVAVDELLSSRPVRLSTLFDDTAIGPAARRARTVKAKAAENFEERGLQTLFLAWGMATWPNPRGTAVPAAPVLLRQAALTARGGAGEDFSVSLPGEWEINPTLLHLLKTDYQVELHKSELLELLDQEGEPPDPVPLFERLSKAASMIPGFSVRSRVVLGNFSYAKLPMVLDLQTAADTLIASELICAIAGDEGARDAVRARHPNVTLNAPDIVPPADEFLVLDADASQSYAINCGVGGADLVIDGPPGTGKSQTIANLIAALSARGLRILFVAEKRAAIDAVLDRLERVKLADLVLDVHDGAGSKRKLAAELARTLALASNLPRPEMTALQETLVRSRQVLVGHAEALHAPRSPWGVSVYEIQSGLLGVPAAARSAQRLRGETLTRLDGPAFRQAQADLDSFIALGGLSLSEATSPWAGAFAAGTISTPDTARAALDAAHTLIGHTLPKTAARLEQILADCALSAPRTVDMWVQALGLLDGVAVTLAVFDPAIFDSPLDELAAALGPAARGMFGRLSARIGNREYRRARTTALSLWRAAKPKPAALHTAVAAAASQAAAWGQAALDGGRPRLPTDLAGADGAFGQLSAEMQSPGRLGSDR